MEAGAIHGCVLCEKNYPLIYMEDVGRHNAIDKIAGYISKHNITTSNKIFYTTGRLTSEMVIKTVKMGIPILISRSGFTAWGVQLSKKTNLTLIGRARGKRFLVLSVTPESKPPNIPPKHNGSFSELIIISSSLRKADFAIAQYPSTLPNIQNANKPVINNIILRVESFF